MTVGSGSSASPERRPLVQHANMLVVCAIWPKARRRSSSLRHGPGACVRNCVRGWRYRHHCASGTAVAIGSVAGEASHLRPQRSKRSRMRGRPSHAASPAGAKARPPLRRPDAGSSRNPASASAMDTRSAPPSWFRDRLVRVSKSRRRANCAPTSCLRSRRACVSPRVSRLDPHLRCAASG